MKTASRAYGPNIGLYGTARAHLGAYHPGLGSSQSASYAVVFICGVLAFALTPCYRPFCKTPSGQDQVCALQAGSLGTHEGVEAGSLGTYFVAMEPPGC